MTDPTERSRPRHHLRLTRQTTGERHPICPKRITGSRPSSCSTLPPPKAEPIAEAPGFSVLPVNEENSSAGANFEQACPVHTYCYSAVAQETTNRKRPPPSRLRASRMPTSIPAKWELGLLQAYFVSCIHGHRLAIGPTAIPTKILYLKQITLQDQQCTVACAVLHVRPRDCGHAVDIIAVSLCPGCSSKKCGQATTTWRKEIPTEYSVQATSYCRCGTILGLLFG